MQCHQVTHLCDATCNVDFELLSSKKSLKTILHFAKFLFILDKSMHDCHFFVCWNCKIWLVNVFFLIWLKSIQISCMSAIIWSINFWFFLLKEPEKAVESYERAVKLSADPEFALRSARVLVKTHQYAQAVKRYRESGTSHKSLRPSY